MLYFSHFIYTYILVKIVANVDKKYLRFDNVQKDGSELPTGRYSLIDGNLTISEVSEDDRGVYVCAVSNAADELAVETELLIENVPPRAPYNLTALASYDSIHLSWVPGRDFFLSIVGSIMKFTIT